MLTTVIIDENGRVNGYYTLKEISKMWNVSEILLRTWISRGILKSLKIGRQNYIKKGTEKPETGPRGRKPREQNTFLNEG